MSRLMKIAYFVSLSILLFLIVFALVNGKEIPFIAFVPFIMFGILGAKQLFKKSDDRKNKYIEDNLK